MELSIKHLRVTLSIMLYLCNLEFLKQIYYVSSTPSSFVASTALYFGSNPLEFA